MQPLRVVEIRRRRFTVRQQRSRGHLTPFDRSAVRVFAYDRRVVGTRFEINADRESVLSGVRGTVTLLWFEYRGFTHPGAGSAMRPEVADRVENDLQRYILSRRIRSTKLIKLTPARYLAIEPFSTTGRAGKRFIRYANVLDRNLLTPRGHGFERGVPFWGSISASIVRANDLRPALSAADGIDFRRLSEMSVRPDFANVFYTGPKTAAVVSSAGQVYGGPLPNFRHTPTVVGSYPGSTRLRLSSDGPEGTEHELFNRWEFYPGLGGEGSTHVAIDIWDHWSEIVPFSAQGPLPTGPPDVLEPLVYGLWHKIDELGASQSRQANELQWALIALADALEGRDRGRLRTALLWILSTVMTLGLGVTSNLVWDSYGQQIKDLLDHLP